MTNPLLNFDQQPLFESIQAQHVVPALQSALEEARSRISELENIPSPNWHNFALPMEELDERLSRVWSPVSHLNGVMDSEELRSAYETGIEMLTAYHSEVSQNKNLFGQYKKLKGGDDWHELDEAQKKLIENNLLDFVLGGAELSEPKQERFTAIKQELSQLSTRFERNLLDATQAWRMLIDDEQRLAGLPKSARDMAKQSAQAEDENGWLFNLQIPSYLAVMQHSSDSELRREMYQAYSKRASELADGGQFDNSPLIQAILKLREEQAELLGYSTYAEYSLVRKMAGSAKEVIEFLSELATHARPMALQEMAALQAFSKREYDIDSFEPWDISYYSERLREHQYAFNDEQVKPYFPAEQVFNGLFEISSRLFGIEIKQNPSFETWHDEVRCFDLISAENSELIGSFYADLYVRKNKRGGAWMDTCIHRQRGSEGLQKPIAFLTCNFSPPIGDDPALLSHDEVETLFHEFGHTLHHLLTEVDVMGVAGINGVAWDAVELPSQFLENWCWHDESLPLIAKHFETEESIPNELLSKMRAAKNFQSGLQTLRQIEFALFDMRLHNEPGSDVQSILDEVRAEVAIIQPPEYNRFQNSFGHIFAGGYAAGYYSYKWSEVLSADAFGRFEEEGIFNPETGKDFSQSILQRGGVEDANILFHNFRQRPPEISALLRHSGLINNDTNVELEH